MRHLRKYIRPRLIDAVAATPLALFCAIWVATTFCERHIWRKSESAGSDVVIRSTLFQPRPGGFSISFDRTVAAEGIAAAANARTWNDHANWRSPPDTFDPDYLLGVWGDLAPTATIGIPYYDWAYRDGQLSERQWGFAVRFPTLIMTVALPPLALTAGWRWWNWRRRFELEDAGLCPSCGYDLRATPDRCPECGRLSANPAAA